MTAMLSPASATRTSARWPVVLLRARLIREFRHPVHVHLDPFVVVARNHHYAFGAVAQWLSEGIAGIAPAEPGYRVVRVQPLVGGGITHAAASITTPFGVARSRWRVVGELVELDVTIPPGAAGDIRLGDGWVERVGSGTHRFKWRAG
ncbi:hypothetical protein OH799_09995 [Nocardia sp. NBC_00881]|uniref:alpha-L-rhamnosidase C-terminal domain-containing protein n=1 Tax=Nocardia sp. NBC_00881 TaxID=2975995 RepID=UPI0038708864|nr:hypothetical protein OH799_09995 [Nocardia sp. NBC_00881]